MKTIKTYYRLTKPGIVYGNLLNALGGFLLASHLPYDLAALATMLFGLGLIIASACVLNNYFDQDIDANMERTKTRALPMAHLTNTAAVTFATLLLAVGSATLFFYNNFLSLEVALLGFALYLFVYSPLKRHSAYATHVGAIAGALPPVVGYVVVTNHLDLGAFILFSIIALWQMPHFFAIATYRRAEYAEAHVPVWPVVKTELSTKISIVAYCGAFVVAVFALYLTHYVDIWYAVVMGASSLFWFGLTLQGFTTLNKNAWARKVFYCSLVVVLLLCGALTLHK